MVGEKTFSCTKYRHFECIISCILEVSNGDSQNHLGIRRRSILTSSDAETDLEPIDYILVYHDHDHDNNDEQENDHRPERRKIFEDYLKTKHRFILQRVVCIEINEFKFEFIFIIRNRNELWMYMLKFMHHLILFYRLQKVYE